ESWKRGLFSHHLAILYCYETEKGKQILSGAVIKTNAPHPSELENGIAIRINERFPKLKSTQEKYPLCQIFSKVIPSSDNMDTLDACLQPLKAFFLEEQAKLDF
ncbi:TPA: YjeJ family protein, partial [Klebsiella pneumoniae]